MLMPLAKGISVIMPDATNRYPYCICMYIEGDHRAVIDFGAGIKAFSEIDKDSVDIGLLTHYHPDHTHSSVLFHSSDFYASEEEAGAYSSLECFLELHGRAFWGGLMNNIPKPALKDVLGSNKDIPVQPGFIKINLAGNITDGQQFDLGRGRHFTAVHLPGHTSGHYGFYFEKEGIMFSADIDLTRIGPWYGCGCSHVGQFINSINLIKEINPAVIASSHRRPLTKNIIQSLDAYLQIMLDREQRIYELLTEPHSIQQLAANELAFKVKTNVMEEFWGKMFIYRHLEHMMETGSVIEIESGVYRQA